MANTCWRIIKRTNDRQAFCSRNLQNHITCDFLVQTRQSAHWFRSMLGTLPRRSRRNLHPTAQEVQFSPDKEPLSKRSPSGAHQGFASGVREHWVTHTRLPALTNQPCESCGPGHRCQNQTNNRRSKTSRRLSLDDRDSLLKRSHECAEVTRQAHWHEGVEPSSNMLVISRSKMHVIMNSVSPAWHPGRRSPAHAFT